MRELARKARLAESLNADTISVVKDRYFVGAYAIDLPLDETPDHVWQDNFERMWKSSRQLWERKLFVVGDKLRLITPIEDLEGKLKWVKDVISQTNMEIDEYNRQEAWKQRQLTDEMLNRNLQEEEDAAAMVRQVIRKNFTSI